MSQVYAIYHISVYGKKSLTYLWIKATCGLLALVCTCLRQGCCY